MAVGQLGAGMRLRESLVKNSVGFVIRCKECSQQTIIYVKGIPLCLICDRRLIAEILEWGDSTEAVKVPTPSD